MSQEECGSICRPSCPPSLPHQHLILPTIYVIQAASPLWFRNKGVILFWVRSSSPEKLLCKRQKQKKANKASECCEPMHFRSVCGFLQSRQSSLCVPPGRLQPLLCQPTQRSGAKIAHTHPRAWGSPAFAYTSTFLPAAGRETEGQAYEMCMQTHTRWTPLWYL